jgi:hypothetical protein
LSAPSTSGVVFSGIVARKWGAFWLEDSVPPSLVLQIAEAVMDRVTAPGVVPAIVSKIIVSLVFEQDMSAGPPWTMGMALGVITTPTRAALTPAMLATTAPPPLPRGGSD